jgi:hypothetical protein
MQLNLQFDTLRGCDVQPCLIVQLSVFGVVLCPLSLTLHRTVRDFTIPGCMCILLCCCRLISDHQLETTGSGQLTPVLRLLAGAGAGIVAMSATYPLDMVSSRCVDSCEFL